MAATLARSCSRSMRTPSCPGELAAVVRCSRPLLHPHAIGVRPSVDMVQMRYWPSWQSPDRPSKTQPICLVTQLSSPGPARRCALAVAPGRAWSCLVAAVAVGTRDSTVESVEALFGAGGRGPGRRRGWTVKRSRPGGPVPSGQTRGQRGPSVDASQLAGAPSHSCGGAPP